MRGAKTWRRVMALAMVWMAALTGSVVGKTEREAKAQEWEEKLYREAAAYAEDDFVVVIDAGHGARDVGKVGVNGEYEKEINLAIANRLYEYLCQSDVKVVRTRPEDDSLYDASAANKKMADMRLRCQVAEECHADIVVSIHQNSYSDPSVCGPQLFYCAGSAEGKELAELLQASFDGVVGAEHNTRVPKANSEYYLLVHMPCPTVVAECGFLSNPEEAALLATEEYQDRIAWNLYMGIMQYANRKRG